MYLIVSTFFSCSKDTDLLADYVTPGGFDGKLTRFVVDDSFVVTANSNIRLDVLANDTFPDRENVGIVRTSSPASGSVSINEDNSLSYSSASPETTTDTFTYTVQVVEEDNSVSEETGTVTVIVSEEESVALKAFPSAYGGGSDATGGRGKALAIITTLNRNASLTYHGATENNDEYYTGGLYAALQNNSVGYIVFNISGNVDLGQGGTGSQFGHPGMPGVNNKTIFGQSAPKGGITLTGGTFRLDGSDGDNQNLIFRYIRSRPRLNKNGILTPEDDAFTWGFLLFGGNDMIIDHCSASFAQDKAMGAFINSTHVPEHSLTKVTFSNNLISDSGTGAYTSINPGQAENPERYVDLISWNRNVIVSVNRTPNLAFDGSAEKVNNIIHNTPFKQTSAYHSLKLNEIGNYYSRSSSKNKIREDFESGAPLIFTSDNYFEGILSGAGDSSKNNQEIWTLKDGVTLAGVDYFVDSPFAGFTNPVPVWTPEEAFNNLAKKGDVGAYKYLDDEGKVQVYRDSFDTAQISIVANNQVYTGNIMSNWVLPSIPTNTRPSSYDSDNDGMADAWEKAKFGDLSQSYRDDYDGDGYENIEEYMNQVDFQ